MSKEFPKDFLSYLLGRVNEKKHTDFTTLAHVTSFSVGKKDLVLDGTQNKQTLTCSHFVKN